MGLVAAADPEPIAASFAKATGLPVLAFAIEGGDELPIEVWRHTLSSRLKDLTGLVAADTVRAGEALHLAAARWQTRAISGVEDIETTAPVVRFRRAVYGQKLCEWVSVDRPPYVVLVQPGAFGGETLEVAESRKIEMVSLPACPVDFHLRETTEPETSGVSLAQAAVIVAVGRGIGARENIALAEQLVARFTQGAVAGSRPLCDQNWLPYDRQVGQTGTTVSPKLYLALGISGSSQHVAGMRGSQFVVAVNTDPTAAIFQHADVGIVDDAVALLQTLNTHED